MPLPKYSTTELSSVPRKSTMHKNINGSIVLSPQTPYFHAFIFAIEGLDVNEPPSLTPRSAVLVLFFNVPLASTKFVGAETDSLGPGLDGLVMGIIDARFLG